MLTTDQWVYDSASTAEALASWLKANPAQIVLCGKQATDSDNNQMAANLAARLGYGCVTEVSKLELADGTFTAERDIEGAREIVSCKTPAVISCNKGLNEPKPANLKSIMAAKKTSELIPLCHPLMLSKVEVRVTPGDGGLSVAARVRTSGQTGVEMEALTAVSVACLTIYDMLKAAEKGMVIEAVRLTAKSGGASGDWSAA